MAVNAEPEAPAGVSKSYSSPFAIDRAKLTRIVTIIDERSQRAGASTVSAFEVRLKNGKMIALGALDEVFRGDFNTPHSLSFSATTRCQ